MRYAIFSDIHNQINALKTVLQHANQQQVDRYFCLGDIGEIGAETCVTLIREMAVPTVFGNWETFSWISFSSENEKWVSNLPPLLKETNFWLAHAAPFWPEMIGTLADFHHQRHKINVSSFFPRLHVVSPTLQQAINTLREAHIPLFFHGHTHHQVAWRFTKKEGLHKITDPIIHPKSDETWVIGVGSVGHPEDNSKSSYVIYDDTTHTIEMIRVPDKKTLKY